MLLLSQLRPRRSFALLIFLLLGVILAGCQEELGPVPRPTAPVTGRVSLANQPIKKGWVEFLPVEGTVGNLRSARLRPDGSFQAEGVAVGTNAIRIVGTPLPPALYDMFGQRYVIRRTIPAAGLLNLDIDLQDEYQQVLQ